jgi:ligand-binding sensor domain-containing protein
MYCKLTDFPHVDEQQLRGCLFFRQKMIDIRHRKASYTCRIAFAVIMTICGLLPAFALDPQKTINQYGHNVWFRQNGLPANAVNVGLQGRDGYLWLGTSAGLFRFDGVNFIPVNTNPRDSKVIETISALCISRDSSLWIGTTFSGLRRIKNGIISRYGGSEGLPSRQIRVMLESRAGHIWIGSSYGLYVYNNEKFVAVPISPTYITALTEDTLGRIWVGTHSGVRIFDDMQLKQVDSILVSNGLPNDIVSSLFADHKANVWIGTIGGLTRWNNGNIKNYKLADGLVDNHVTAICEDRDYNLWFGTSKGISRLSQNKWSTMTALDGLTNNNVLGFFEDHEGSIWICTLEGLNQLKDVNITSYTTREGIANDYISGVVETPDKSLYILSNADGSITRMKDNNITKLKINVGPAYIARDGSLWIGQTGLLFNIKDGKIAHRFDRRSDLPMKWVSAIGEDNKSMVIFLDAIGIRRFIDGHIRPYLLADGQQYSSTEYVVCFYLEPNGTFWIGTTNGLVKVKDGRTTTYSTQDGLAGHWVNSILDDHQGSLWLTSPSDGLTRFKDGKFTPFTIKDGLFTNEFYCVLCDNQGDLWLSSPRGIGYVKRKDIDDYQAGQIKSLYSRVFLSADGMKTDECFGEWQPAGWKAQDGCLWFATKKGVVKVDSKTFKYNTIPPPVLIERIIVDQETVPTDQFTMLSPEKGKLEFHYTALSFLIPDRILFKYKLEGYDHEWVDAGTRRVAYYMNLPPRDYRFHVIACNNDGVWNEVGASFEFKLQPHFYEAYWFYGLLLVALGGAIFGGYRLRLLQLLSREKELQKGIQEALANVKTLSGLLPICANCKKIRNDRGYWDQIEGYIQKHSEAQFTHGICPECAEKLYGDVFFKNLNKHKSSSGRGSLSDSMKK